MASATHWYMIRFASLLHCTDCGFNPLGDHEEAVITCIRKYQDDTWHPLLETALRRVGRTCALLEKAARGVVSAVGAIGVPHVLRGIRQVPFVGMLWWPRPLSIDAYDAAFDKAYESLSVLPVTGYAVSIVGLIFNLQVTWTCENVSPRTAQRYQVSDLVWQVWLKFVVFFVRARWQAITSRFIPHYDLSESEDNRPYVTSMTFHKKRQVPPLTTAQAIRAFERFTPGGNNTEYRLDVRLIYGGQACLV